MMEREGYSTLHRRGGRGRGQGVAWYRARGGHSMVGSQEAGRCLSP